MRLSSLISAIATASTFALQLENTSRPSAPSTLPMSKSHKIAIHWYRNGLRFHDNPCLKAACDASETLLPIYIVDPEHPFAQTPGRRAGCIRANFILESMKEIDSKLRGMDSQLLVVLGRPEKIIPEIIALTNASALYYEKESATPVCASDAIVLQAVAEASETENKSSSASVIDEIQIKGFESHTLHPMELYLAKCKGNVAPSTYGSFTKIFQAMKVSQTIEDVTRVPPLPPMAVEHLKEALGEKLHFPTLEDIGYGENTEEQLKDRKEGGLAFDGGEEASLAILRKCMARSQWVATFEKPKTSPNALTVDTTGLSPYIKHGCLSPRRFYHELSNVYSKFNSKNISKPPVSLHGQLMWREYNYLTGYATPNFDKIVDNPIARQIPWDDDPRLVLAWKNGETGYPYIDAIMTQLRKTGWIHHLARHSTACFLTRGDLWQSWEEGAQVFEEELIDADWSINNFNWQWLSCTAHFYQYFRCYSPVAFGKKTDPNGDYIRKWLPQFKDMPKKFIYEPWDAPIEVQKRCGVIVGENYPHPIVDHRTISKSNMGRMKEAYDAHKLEAAATKRKSTEDKKATSKKRKKKETVS